MAAFMVGDLAGLGPITAAAMARRAARAEEGEVPMVPPAAIAVDETNAGRITSGTLGLLPADT